MSGPTSEVRCDRSDCYQVAHPAHWHLPANQALAQLRGHHQDCYQVTGVPADLPVDLCDCRTLRMIDAATRP